ncbi:MAG TPA: PPOX class F420-dependent oxidoreductase, partial [Steroidobacteraceae bacterium]|nr:PPOX class F420-dependent oxidoreductase [Steroidobacteraceae bacterium]
MATSLDKFLDLIKEKKPLAALATTMPDGSPQVTPVWFDWDGKHLRVNTAKGRVKQRNMQQGSRVALAIVDPDNPYRYVQVRGRVALAT